MSDKKRGVNPKDALGTLKPPLGLVPPVANVHEAMAMKFGALGINAKGVKVREGYGPYNWRDTQILASIYIDAIERHLARVKDEGVTVEASDSLCLDLAHIRACTGILLDALEHGSLVDDLRKGGPVGKVIDRFTLKKPETITLDSWPETNPLKEVSATQPPAPGATTSTVRGSISGYEYDSTAVFSEYDPSKKSGAV